MPKSLLKIAYILSDFITINLTFLIWSRLRTTIGLFSMTSIFSIFYLSLYIYLFWVMLLAFFGHYRTWFTRSRTDEWISVAKTISFGIFIIFILTTDLGRDLSQPVKMSRFLILSYWVLMVFFVGLGRTIVTTIHRKLLIKGIGLRRTVIVGWGSKARDLFDKVREAPALGYDIIGFVSPEILEKPESYKDVKVLGPLDNLNKIIESQSVQEVLIGLTRRSEKKLEQVIRQCEGRPVGIQIIPDLYDVIIGQVKTNQIYGFPLIEILPQLMPPWEQVVKRISDVIFSCFILIGFLPFWILTAVILRLNSKGPVFYTQERVGKDGKIYHMIKFRSMIVGAEKMTGPVWAQKNDPRVTRFGRFMRRVRLDEIPQLINVIKGDMSWVGPRPERPHFVDMFRKEIPLYARRLRVRPGITGWAQIKGGYDESIEHVKQKLEYDLFYLENMSLRMDLKIIFATLYILICFKGH